MQISARNQLAGTVTSVDRGAVNGIVTIEGGFGRVKAGITNDAIDELGLAEGMAAVAVAKATSVMFATGAIAGLSARNQLAGKVVEVKRGAVNGHVTVELADGQTVKGSITNDAIDELGLVVGETATAVIKATDLMVGVEE
ncbi:TOBE domain-containing protein [Caniella muris]|uniref:TOBE domain-containing protein n=1 Tax=Caniella muris TaxID=2941502 RepID=UPI002040A06D|nr:TOBE domain-containing protein [Caniella muris]